MHIYIYIYIYKENFFYYFEMATRTSDIYKINVKQVVSQYKRNKNDKFIAEYLLQYFLNHETNSLMDVVNNLPYISGDLQLENDDIKASFLWMAVFSNNVLLTKKLLYNGNCNINTIGTYKTENFINVTPIFIACSLGNDYIEMFHTLLTNCTKTNTIDQNGYTPLMKTVFYNNEFNSIEICNWLLFHNADINMKDNKGNTVLHWAIFKNKYKYFAYLLHRQADPFIKNKNKDNSIISFIINLVQYRDDGNDDDHNDIELKISLLDFLIKELEKNNHICHNVIYELFGAILFPTNIYTQKMIWSKSLEKSMEKVTIEDKKLLNVIGYNKYEFKTREDLNRVVSELDCMIQSTFICQRILSKGHPLIMKNLKRIIYYYENNENFTDFMNMLMYLLEYIDDNDDEGIHYIIYFFSIDILNKCDFIDIFNFINDFSKKLIKRRDRIMEITSTTLEINWKSHYGAIYHLCSVIYDLYHTFKHDKTYLKKLKNFLEKKLIPANLEVLEIYGSYKVKYSVLDILTHKIKTDEEFLKFLSSMTIEQPY